MKISKESKSETSSKALTLTATFKIPLFVRDLQYVWDWCHTKDHKPEFPLIEDEASFIEALAFWVEHSERWPLTDDDSTEVTNHNAITAWIEEGEGFDPRSFDVDYELEWGWKDGR